jgi:hypothetical protein
MQQRIIKQLNNIFLYIIKINNLTNRLTNINMLII